MTARLVRSSRRGDRLVRVKAKELRALRAVRDIVTELINEGEVLILRADGTADRLIEQCNKAGPE